MLSTSLPLTATLSSVFVAVSPDGTFIDEPAPKQIETATSIHAVAFSSQGSLVLAECEGKFNIDQWEKVVNHAKTICLGAESAEEANEDVDMNEGQEDSLHDFVKALMDEKISNDQSWKESLK